MSVRFIPAVLAVAMAVTGCAGLQQSEPEPQAPEREDAAPEPASETPEPEETQKIEAETQSEPEPEPNPQPEAEQDTGFEVALQWDEQSLAQSEARLDSQDDVAAALSALHRSAPGGFLAPVVEYVESEMGLDLGQSDSARTHACPDGGTFSHKWLENEQQRRPGVRTVLYEFDGCRGHFRQDEQMKISGAFARSFEPVAGGDHVHLTFDVSGRAQSSEGEQALRLRGRQENRHPEEGGLVRITPVLELQVGDEYIALEDFREQMSVVEPDGQGEADFPAFSSSFETHLSGRLISSELEGALQVSTPRVLADRHPPCAATGVLRFESDRLAEVRYGPDTGIAALVSVELDNQLLLRYRSCDDFAQDLGLDAPWRFTNQ